MKAKSGPKPQSFQPSLPAFGDRRRRRIGLLGGSFNPAHAGHLHISREAMKRLGLHGVWWLVSPQNPLKPAKELGSLAQRLAGARALAGKGIVVTDVERRLGATRTARTLALLQQRFPGIAFVWLIGADNLAQIPRWWRWTRIFERTRVAVFDRSPYSYRALAGCGAQRFRAGRGSNFSTLWFRSPPSWVYMAIRRHPASATAIRAGQPPRETRK